MANDFEKFVQNTNESEAHSQEIQQTRIGGLGGSDAAMVLKIGRGGLAALSNTDIKRLAVMCGKADPDNFGGNMYTQAGHKFEDWYEQNVLKDMDAPAGYEREFVMSSPLAKNFKTFAHADFMLGENFTAPEIVECKFVSGKDDEAVAKTYYAQLQWYYMLGAHSVTLLHGAGTVDDPDAGTEFEVLDASMMKIERDEDVVKILLAGIKTLDKALGDGWEPIVRDKADFTDTPDVVQAAFNLLAVAKTKAAEAKADEEQAKGVLREYMDDLGYNGIVNQETGKQVYIVSGKMSSKFDLKVFKKNIAEKAENDPNVSLTLEQIMETIEESTKMVKTEPSITFK